LIFPYDNILTLTEKKLTKIKDRMLEVELFIGEQLEDLTNDQVLKAVDKKYGSYWVEYAKELLDEFADEIRSTRIADSWGA
jgi:hypothetical protein|tara:strand:- start:932 stop:1174 length:243 start_codon:yes stop_codon:yes gene_type:complete